MAIEKILQRQRDFSGGQINEDALRRDDLPIFQRAVRHARNVETIDEGGLIRRRGRKLIRQYSGRHDEFRPSPGQVFHLDFYAGKLDVYDSSFVLIVSLTAPWSDPAELVWDFFREKIFVAWSGRTQVVVFDKNQSVPVNAWSIANFEFEEALSGTINAPFYRFEPDGSTLQPSDYNGVVDITFSTPALDPAHVGTLFRYAGRQLKILSVSSSTTGTAQCLERMPLCYRFNLSGTTNGFEVGHIVEGKDSGYVGQVVEVIDENRINVITNGSEIDPENDELLVGPFAQSPLENEGVYAVPLPSFIWDEQFASDYRGWPKSLKFDAQRLIFCDFQQLQEGVLWSAVSVATDFRVGAAASDAIFEYIPEECRVFHVIGIRDQFMITSIGVFHVPISGANPLQPGSVEFRPVFRGLVSDVRPEAVSDGILFVDGYQKRIHSITATGQTARPYIANELTAFHSDLFAGIVRVMASNVSRESAVLQVYAINSDGSVCVGRYIPGTDYTGWLKIIDTHPVKEVSSRYNELRLISEYTIDGGPVRAIETLDETALFDLNVDVLPGGAVTKTGDRQWQVTGTNLSLFAEDECDVMADGKYLGRFPVNASGQLVIDYEPKATLSVGLNFAPTLKPHLITADTGTDRKQRMRRRKIAKLAVAVGQSQEFQIEGSSVCGYRMGDNQENAQPLRDDVFRKGVRGRSFDPTVTISQATPGALRILEITQLGTV